MTLSTEARGFYLRPAVEADRTTIRRLVHQASINPIDLHWQRFVVAEDDEREIIGCGQIKSHRDGSRELASIVVADEWQGKGVARAVIEHLMLEAGAPLWLTCRSGLVPLYAKFSFRPVGPEEPQPAYFRRLRKLAKAVGMVIGKGETMAVMVNEGEREAGRPTN